MTALALPQPDYDPTDKLSGKPRSQWRVRASHYLDSWVSGQNRSRRLQNWCNVFNAESQSWGASQLQQANISGLPFGWVDRFDLDYWVGGKNVPLQSVASDTLPRWGWFRSDRPGLFVLFQRLDANMTGRTLRPNLHAIDYLMDDGSVMRCQAGLGSTRKVIRYPGAPAQWPRFAVLLPPGCSVALEGQSVIRFLDPDGNEYARTRPLIGWWGGDENGPDIESGGVGTLEAVDLGPVSLGGLNGRRFELQPLAGWGAYPGGLVHIDPTTTISGAAAIEDNYTQNTAPTTNRGGDVGTQANFGRYAVQERRLLSRILDPGTNIPAGTITAASMFFTRRSTANSTISANLNAFAIKNWAAWGELTSSWHNYDTGSAWITSGPGAQGPDDDPTDATADYDNSTDMSANYPDYTAGANYDEEFAFDSFLNFIAFRDGIRTNNGWVFTPDRPDIGTWIAGVNSAESGGLWFTVDYTAAAGGFIPAVLSSGVVI